MYALRGVQCHRALNTDRIEFFDQGQFVERAIDASFVNPVDMLAELADDNRELTRSNRASASSIAAKPPVCGVMPFVLDADGNAPSPNAQRSLASR